MSLFERSKLGARVPETERRVNHKMAPIKGEGGKTLCKENCKTVHAQYS